MILGFSRFVEKDFGQGEKDLVFRFFLSRDSLLVVAACFFFVSGGKEVRVLGIVPGAGADAVLSRTSLPLGVFIINSLLSLSPGGASCQGWPG